MASVSATSASSLNAQMEDVAEKLFVHIHRESPEMQIFNLVTKQLDGKYYRVDFQTAGNAYMASRPLEQGSGVYQPGYDPSSSAEDGMADYSIGEMKFYAKRHYFSTDFTGAMKSAVKSRKGGYMNLQEFRFKDTLDNMKEQMGIKIATSQLGTRARIQAINTGTGVVNVRYAGYSAASTSTFENGLRYIRPGMRMDAVTSSRTGALRVGAGDRGRKVTAVAMDIGTSGTGPAVTFNNLSGCTWTAGDYLLMYGERGSVTGSVSSSTDYDNLPGMLGLIDAVDDGTLVAYYGQAQRSAYPTLQAIVQGNSGTLRALTPQIVNYSIEQKVQLTGGMVDIAYSTPGVVRQLVDHLTIIGTGSSGNTSNNNPMRYEPGKSSQTIGFNKVSLMPLGFNGSLEMVSSRLAPHHTLFLFEKETAILLQDGPPRFINEDGLTIRKVTGKDEFTADWVWPATGIVCREPWKNIRIDDLAGDHATLSPP